jgi:UDP-N-acetylmuramyl tripeptide synthase
VFEAAYVGHLGDYRCPACGHARPALAVVAREIELEGLAGASFSLETPTGATRVRLPLPGLYNVYNAVGAAALAQGLGAPLEEIRDGLERFGAAFGRFERIAVGDKSLLVLLIKNPAGANEVVRTLEDAGAPPLLLVALNDAIADGQDVSWIWDVDFEPLLAATERVIVSGDRAAELALRCTYGGLPEEALEVEPALEAALDRGLALTPAGGELVVLPTYTAMLALRRIVVDRGLVRPYWERAS